MSIDFAAINKAATTGTTTTKNGSLVSGKNSTMGKQEFLTLLVAQLQNQDPLNPDEGTEFTAQLAQFSSLEQLMSINKGMGNMITSTSNSDNIALLNTIGKEVLYYGDEIDFQGDPVEFGYMLAENATSVKIELRLNGETVHSIDSTELSKGDHTFTWDGMTEDGNPAAHGAYKIVVAAQGAKNAIIAPPIIKSKVTGVNLDPLLPTSLTTTLGGIDSYSKIIGISEIPQQAASPKLPESEETPKDEEK
ncbi:flagellar hook assembly protein FlgD [Desulfotalea psychrophila]|uniref:Basal-body rod modification protein FlgD n=1 Tax=Desulfotalea psychrophila (strain LSv54 / DSM 12343) TaxID=177439 RepID=Q6AJT4_DESPS|nr:flagellar hook assembly protein FlgD [Desulfotalea psychrophila]CAG37392.1 related to basal-body rod modification protein (FlgD) [Desulfotalea psychrophila LSv54]